jgi:hypothetical protein
VMPRASWSSRHPVSARIFVRILTHGRKALDDTLVIESRDLRSPHVAHPVL